MSTSFSYHFSFSSKTFHAGLSLLGLVGRILGYRHEEEAVSYSLAIQGDAVMFVVDGDDTVQDSLTLIGQMFSKVKAVSEVVPGKYPMMEIKQGLDLSALMLRVYSGLVDHETLSEPSDFVQFEEEIADLHQYISKKLCK